MLVKTLNKRGEVLQKNILIISLLAMVFVIFGLDRELLAAQDLQPQWSGEYDVVITTSDQQQLETTIDIRDLGHGQLEVTATLEDQTVTQMGEYRGDPEGEGLQAHFDIDHFGLVQGSADFTIRRVEKIYQIQGQAAISSRLTGQLRGDFHGQRRGLVATPVTPAPSPDGKETPPGTGAPGFWTWLAGAGLLLVLLATLSKRKRSGR